MCLRMRSLIYHRRLKSKSTYSSCFKDGAFSQGGIIYFHVHVALFGPITYIIMPLYVFPPCHVLPTPLHKVQTYPRPLQNGRASCCSFLDRSRSNLNFSFASCSFLYSNPQNLLTLSVAYCSWSQVIKTFMARPLFESIFTYAFDNYYY